MLSNSTYTMLYWMVPVSSQTFLFSSSSIFFIFSPPQTLFSTSITPALLFSPPPLIRHHWLPLQVSHHFGHSLCCGLLPHLLPLHFLNVNADCSHNLDSSCTDCYQPLLTHDWCCIGPIDDWYQYWTEILILVVGISFVFFLFWMTTIFVSLHDPVHGAPYW